MRILLRHTKTGKYYQTPAIWTDHAEQATSFGSSGEAILAAYEKKFKDVEILLAFEDSLYNIRVPLNPPEG